MTQDYHVIDIALKTFLVFPVIADRKPRPLSRNELMSFETLLAHNKKRSEQDQAAERIRQNRESVRSFRCKAFFVSLHQRL